MAYRKKDTRHSPPPDASAPIRRFTDLNELTQAGRDIEFVAEPEERAALTEWAGVRAVKAFSGKATLRRLSTTRFAIRASFEAEIEQTCVVTLEPMTSQLSGELSRELFYCEAADSEGGELTLAAGDDDAPDTVTSYKYDVCLPLLEEFSLSINPYPRKEGAVFAEKTGESKERNNPFAALKVLKDEIKPGEE